MYQAYKDQAQFYIVYIREAHPGGGKDSRQKRMSGGKDIAQPETEEERHAVATKAVKELKFTIPVLVDDMHNSTDKAYSGFPDRLYVIGKAGKIAYRGERGPRGFKPDLMETELKKVLANDGFLPGLLPEGMDYGAFESKAMNKKFGYTIYLPKGHERGGERYPVIYWLHGLNGNEFTGMHVSTNLAAAIRNKTMPPAIMVFPYGGKGTMYSDSYNRKVLVETVLIKELIPHIDKTYRTIAEQKGRMIEGFSMGGFGAVKLGLKYPDMFSSVVSYAGALHTEETLARKRASIYELMFGGRSEAFAPHSPTKIAAGNAKAIKKQVQLRLVVGTKDPTLQYNRDFHAHLEKLGIEHEYEELEGLGHQAKQVYMANGEKGFAFHARGLKKP